VADVSFQTIRHLFYSSHFFFPVGHQSETIAVTRALTTEGGGISTLNLNLIFGDS
jgi:hypothetical protein